MRTLATQPAKSVDRELARIQTYVLDSLAPITALLENSKMPTKEVPEASSAATVLIGNAKYKDFTPPEREICGVNKQEFDTPGER